MGTLQLTSAASVLDWGNPSAFNNLDPCSMFVWYYPTAHGNDLRIFTKEPNGLRFMMKTVSTNVGNLRGLHQRATVNANYVSNGQELLTLNQWYCLGCVFDSNAAQTIKMYHGGLTTSMAEVSGYAVSDAGSGTPNDDSADNLLVGNNIPRTKNAPGRYGPHMMFNAALTVTQLERLRIQNRPQADMNCVLWARPGMGEGGITRIPDLKGNGGVAVPVSGSLAAGIPLRWELGMQSAQQYSIRLEQSLGDVEMDGPFLRSYGEDMVIPFRLVNPSTGHCKSGISFTSGDSQLSKNEGTYAATTNLPFSVGDTYVIPIPASNARFKRGMIKIVDQQSPKRWRDQVIVIETYGNKNAAHEFDLGDANQSSCQYSNPLTNQRLGIEHNQPIRK